jgi:Protein  of unknown function (DUF3018)
MSWRPETGKNPAYSRPDSHRLRRLMRDVRAEMRDPEFLAELRREGAMMRHHPENDAIDEWIEAVYDWDEWPPFDAP